MRRRKEKRTKKMSKERRGIRKKGGGCLLHLKGEKMEEVRQEQKKKRSIEYEFENGEKTEMSLTFEKLLMLRNEDKELYYGVNKVLTKGPEEITDVITALYAAYKCTHFENKEILTYKGFMEEMNQDYKYNVDILSDLIAPSKKRVSGKYF